MTSEMDGQAWAFEQFAEVDLPDARLQRRLVAMAAGAARRPAGRVTAVFTESSARQGAYDLLENRRVERQSMTEAVGGATARRSSAHQYVFVSVDGTSLTVTDRTRRKGFGALGTTQHSNRGLKVINAYAIEPSGVPLGLLDQQWWARRRRKKRWDHQRRPVAKKETRFWLQSIEAAAERLDEHGEGCRPWFVVDREGDNVSVLGLLASMGALFTVRSNRNRSVQVLEGKSCLLDELGAEVPVDELELAVRGGPRRKARSARMELRAKTVSLVLRDQLSGRVTRMDCWVVESREVGTTPPGEKPLEWRLLTSHPVHNAQDARRVVFSYAQRWKVEELHKTWKSGACNVESNQLRGFDRVAKWATIMAAVASRIERIKVQSREEPSLPASTELTEYEIRALILLKRKEKKRTEEIPNTMPTLGQATLWIAELGGYTGKSSGGPPGSITIRRGLERIIPAAQILEIQATEPEEDDSEMR